MRAETMVGWYLQGIIIPGLLRWCRFWSIHSMDTPFWIPENLKRSANWIPRALGSGERFLRRVMTRRPHKSRTEKYKYDIYIYICIYFSGGCQKERSFKGAKGGDATFLV